MDLKARMKIWKRLDDIDKLSAWFQAKGQTADLKDTLREKAILTQSLPLRATKEILDDIAALEERARILEAKTYTYTGPYLSKEEWMCATDEDPDYALFWQQGRDGLDKLEIATIYLPFLRKEIAIDS